MAKSPLKGASKAAAKSTAKPKRAATRSTTKAVSKTPTAAKPGAKSKTKPLVKSANAVKDVDLRPDMRKKELIERVAKLSGMKPGEARRAVDATLEGLRDVLDEGHNVAAAPLGKVMVTREKETKNGKLVVCRIKLKPKETSAPKDPLAQAAE